MDSSSVKKIIQEKVLYVLLVIMIVMGFTQYHVIADYASSFTSAPHLLGKAKYDVFPSFHGKDVRRGFLSHLLKEFKSERIDTFIDKDHIESGDQLGPVLIESIRGSKIALVVLSRNYTSSTWCLNELAEIMSCNEKFGLMVMVVFYEVEPTHVKKQIGSFGSTFRKTCAGKRKYDIMRWTRALFKVSTIAGYHSSTWDNEAAMIEQIANDVTTKLNYSKTISIPTR